MNARHQQDGTVKRIEQTRRREAALHVHGDGLHGRWVSSLVDHPAGIVLARFGRSHRRPAPDMHTVQRGAGEHLDLVPEMLRYINHSCDPNVIVDVDNFEVVSLTPIGAGEELSFFYPSTEWDVAAPFDCVCGSPRCVGRVTGARHLPAAVLRGYPLSSFVWAQLRRAGAGGPVRERAAPGARG